MSYTRRYTWKQKVCIIAVSVAALPQRESGGPGEERPRTPDEKRRRRLHAHLGVLTRGHAGRHLVAGHVGPGGSPVSARALF